MKEILPADAPIAILRSAWNSGGKRSLDIVGSGIGLILLSPLLAAVAVAIRLDSPGPVFFKQRRLGRGFRAFRIIKFRTMVENASALGGPLTSGDADPRITRAGRFLRKYKLDELPQLFNVFLGDMSLVGPRPEVERYVGLFRDDYKYLLTVRPGITDPASLAYRDETLLLGRADDAEQEYLTKILPDKIALSRAYIGQSSLWVDLQIVLRTIWRIVAIHAPDGETACIE